MRNNYHFIIAVMLSGITAATAQAQKVTEALALQRAQTFLNNIAEASGARGKAAAPQRLRQLTNVSEDDAIYVFNVGHDNGFVIVSGDERTEQILGYSTEGCIDMNAIPDNMKAWLRGYEDGIRALDEGAPLPAPPVGGRALKGETPVAPMIKTKWGQGWPYYLQTPEIGGQHCQTGCVATSMAMLLNYWQYPAATVKDISAWRGLDAVPAGTTISWNDLCNIYGQSEYNSMYLDTDDRYYDAGWADTNEQQQTAVAQLMKMCGMAVEMNYGIDASDAQALAPLSALKDYFGYKNEMHYLMQDNYTIDAWQRLVYHELAQGRPVMYGGTSSANDFAFTGMGHSFLIDGYNADGYFHINWGWGGSNLTNGYYSLAAQRFFLQASAIVGIQPQTGGTIADVETIGAYTDNTNALELTEVSTEGTLWAMDYRSGQGNIILTLRNNSSQMFKGPITVCLTDGVGMTAADDIIAEVPAGGVAQAVMPYYMTSIEHGINTVRVANQTTGEFIPGAFPITIERNRLPNLNIGFSFDGADEHGLVTYDTPCTLHYNITAQWNGDPALKARLRVNGLPSGEEIVRELGHIAYGGSIEGTLPIDKPVLEPLPDYCPFEISLQVGFYTEDETNEYLKYFYQNGMCESDSKTLVFCHSIPLLADKATEVELEPMSSGDFAYIERPAGYYVFNHEGFVGFNAISMKVDLPELYEYYCDRGWTDYLDGVTDYTGYVKCGGTTVRHKGIYDCPSELPYSSDNIVKTIDNKTIYFPCDQNGMAEAVMRGLYKNEAASFLAGWDNLYLVFTSSGYTSNDIFCNCHLYYYPVAGDANGDGKLDNTDLDCIQQYLGGQTTEQFNVSGADTNSDGIINQDDIEAAKAIIKASEPDGIRKTDDGKWKMENTMTSADALS